MLRPRNSTAYDAALAFLFGRINYERAPAAHFGLDHVKLDRMHEFTRRLGNPHERLRIVHIAGTKGKGSTAAMTASVLTAAGYRTGLYTSPHVHEIEERLCLNGAPCSRDEFAALVAQVRPIVEDMDAEAAAGGDGRIGPTYFEITTAMALVHFAQNQVDAAVLEVGMGGRLDSTNICQPAVCAITSISLDHTKQLGETLSAIAAEKAGILKPGVPVVSGVTWPEPRAVIAKIAAERGSPLFEAGGEFGYARCGNTDDSCHDAGPVFDYWRRDAAGEWFRQQVQLGMLGAHQAANAAVALRIIDELKRQGWSISEQAIRDGLATARCPARIEVIQRRPDVVIDAAHNVASIEALVQTLRESFSPRRKRLIVAASQDKDVPGMLRRLLPEFDEVFLTQFHNNPRFVPVEQLLELAKSLHGATALHVCADAEQAWRQARAGLAVDDLLCVTGSFFLAGGLRRLALEAANRPRPE